MGAFAAEILVLSHEPADPLSQAGLAVWVLGLGIDEDHVIGVCLLLYAPPFNPLYGGFGLYTNNSHFPFTNQRSKLTFLNEEFLYIISYCREIFLL